MVGEIRRLRDEFIDMQIRDEPGLRVLGVVADYWIRWIILNEPSDRGLRGCSMTCGVWQA